MPDGVSGARGAEFLSIAARRGAGPAWLALTNASQFERLGQRERALDHLREMYALTSDEGVKQEIAARIAWSGAGIDLRTGRPAPTAVRAAVRRALDEDSFRRRARELADEMATYDAPSRGTALIEELIDRRAPIPRPSA